MYHACSDWPDLKKSRLVTWIMRKWNKLEVFLVNQLLVDLAMGRLYCPRNPTIAEMIPCNANINTPIRNDLPSERFAIVLVSHTVANATPAPTAESNPNCFQKKSLLADIRFFCLSTYSFLSEKSIEELESFESMKDIKNRQRQLDREKTWCYSPWIETGACNLCQRRSVFMMPTQRDGLCLSCAAMRDLHCVPSHHCKCYKSFSFACEDYMAEKRYNLKMLFQ